MLSLKVSVSPESVKSEVPITPSPISAVGYSRGMSSEIADRIRQVLKKRGLSERELAKRAGFNTTSQLNNTLKRLDKGSTIEVSTLDAIAKGAEVSLVWLQTGEEEPDDGTLWRRIPGWKETVAELNKRAPTIPLEIIERLGNTHGSWAPSPMTFEWLLVQANHALKGLPDAERLKLLQLQMERHMEEQLRIDREAEKTKQPAPSQEPELPGLETSKS